MTAFTNKMIVTIGRQYGSGGLEIGAKLAEKLGVKIYGKEMLKRAAQESGLAEELFEAHDEKPTNSFLYSLVMGNYTLSYSGSGRTELPINHKVFLAQFDTIKNIAKEGPCVLVGRCADYALEELDNVVTVFIYSDMDARIERICKRLGLPESKAKDIIQKTDKKRANYYNYYTNKQWGDTSSYDLCINSAKTGVDGTVEALLEYVRIRNTSANAAQDEN